MTEKQLIFKFQQLRQIKPRKDWVVFTKMSILGADVVDRKEAIWPTFQWTFSNILGILYQKKLAYAFAVFLFIFVGVFSFLEYSLPQSANVKVAEQSTPSLVADATLKNNVEMFKIKSQNYAQLVKSKSNGKSNDDVSLAIKEVNDAAKKLTDIVEKDPQSAKAIALDINNNKSYLDISGNEGNDLSEASDALYKAIVNQMIKDLNKTTLTESQQEALNYVKDFYKKGKYAAALENILGFNISNINADVKNGKNSDSD